MGKEVDAIEEDVSPEEQAKLAKEANNNANVQRLDSMQELAEQRRIDRDAEMAEEGQDVIDTSGKDDEAAALEAEKAAEKEAEELAAAAKKEETQILKVDGEDVEVPVSKILESGVRALQKESTADKRLQEATELLRKAQEQSDKPPSNPDVVLETSPSNVDAETLAKTLIDGNLEEVTNAVQELVGAGRQKSQEMATQVQGMDRNQVYGFVQDAINLESAMSKFKDTPENGGFGDLYNDPTLRKMVMDKEESLVNDGDTRGYIERLSDAATDVREWRDGMMKNAGLSVKDFDAVKDKKLASENTIEGTGGRQTPKQDEKPKSRAEIRKSAIEKMADSRGQTID